MTTIVVYWSIFPPYSELGHVSKTNFWELSQQFYDYRLGTLLVVQLKVFTHGECAKCDITPREKLQLSDILCISGGDFVEKFFCCPPKMRNFFLGGGGRRVTHCLLELNVSVWTLYIIT